MTLAYNIPQVCLNCTREDELTQYTHINTTDEIKGYRATTYNQMSMDVWECNDCYQIGKERVNYFKDPSNAPKLVQLYFRGIGVVIIILSLFFILPDRSLGFFDIIFLILGVIILIYPKIIIDVAWRLTSKYTPMEATSGLMTIRKGNKLVFYSPKFAEFFKEINPEIEIEISDWETFKEKSSIWPSLSR